MNKSILFLPFLQLPSGHHQAAQALIDGIKQVNPSIHCETVDILAYSYGKVETLVSKVYLNWIAAFPGVYNRIYQLSVYNKIEETKQYRLYEWLFLRFMEKLIEEKKPDLIICTHALPAYLVNILKAEQRLHVPVINVYTDYFIHCLWGVSEIDYHFVSSIEDKKHLINKGVKPEQIYITGIPIHPKISKQTTNKDFVKKKDYSILVSGGNLGVGMMQSLIHKLTDCRLEQQIKFYVLCGKNEKLFKKLKQLNHKQLIPLPYIECRDEMNQLYNRIDAILTKPGGVTISESLFKRIPIFIYHALPGQEKINLMKLKDLGLVIDITMEDLLDKMVTILTNEKTLRRYQAQVNQFHAHLDPWEPSEIIMEQIF